MRGLTIDATFSVPAAYTSSIDDPFAHRSLFSQLIHAVGATALFRCWHILIFYGAWATAVALVSDKVHSLAIQPTLLTVIGTVLGFVISYRTTSSFERYNEGRRLWSQIILGARAFARLVWFHIPDVAGDGNFTEAEEQARILIEKKTVINLLLAYSVAVKHYLRGEDGVHYEDLYYLIRFLPAYSLPVTVPSWLPDGNLAAEPEDLPSTGPTPSLPDTDKERGQTVDTLCPAHMPPRASWLDMFPFSIAVRFLSKRGVRMGGRKAARLRARMRDQRDGAHNIPLEISLFLSAYVGTMQKRKALDAPTTTALLAGITQLVDSLTGLERILTTPIPFSYSIHLWTVTAVYCLLLPFQIWATFHWLTIPATVLLSFIFFGFLVAGEEIENPFGYDKNDLNMDHFTHNIIRNELRALTASPPPDVASWAFDSRNDRVFAAHDPHGPRTPTTPAAASIVLAPADWVRRGADAIGASLALT